MSNPIKVRLKILNKYRTPGFAGPKVAESKAFREVFTVSHRDDGDNINYDILSGILKNWYVRIDEVEPVLKQTVLIARSRK